MRILGVAAAILFAIQLVLIERDVLFGSRFAKPPGLSIAVGVLGAFIFVLAIAIATRAWRPKSRTLGVLFIGLALIATVRFHLPRFVLQYQAASREHLIAAEESPELVSFLRQLAAAQEQHRLRAGNYSPSMDSLRDWAKMPAGAVVRIDARADKAWSAEASLAGETCSIWVRDSALREKEWQPEGSPTCGTPEIREPREAIPSLIAPEAILIRFDTSDASGTWLQHRADVLRTGIATDSRDVSAYRWDTRIGGSIRSSVAIAGNQVFVGAHGNGEVVALTLDSGKLGFRIRAPNWVHHEPVVTQDLVIVGFGNNELGVNRRMHTGTDPSGVVAYDRLTGVERWRRYTAGSVMGAPVIRDSVVAVTTGGLDAFGLRLSDGTELWKARLPGKNPMGNPLLLDTLMVAGVEDMNSCAIDVRNGRIVYCRKLAECCWGAGHASAAVSGDLILQTLTQDVLESHQTDEKTGGTLSYYIRKIFVRPAPPVPQTRGAFVVAYDWRDGRERWRASLGTGQMDPGGHMAGTPTIVDGVAYVPSVYNGHVVSINTTSGRVLWSAPIRVARGSVTVMRGVVIAASLDRELIVLDAATGRVTCRQQLPAASDRAGLTVAGETGILALRNGTVMARPIVDWLACRA